MRRKTFPSYNKVLTEGEPHIHMKEEGRKGIWWQSYDLQQNEDILKA